MKFYVYYRAWPHKNLRAIAVEAEDSMTAIEAVEVLLKEEDEKYLRPLIATIVGGSDEL